MMHRHMTPGRLTTTGCLESTVCWVSQKFQACTKQMELSLTLVLTLASCTHLTRQDCVCAQAVLVLDSNFDHVTQCDTTLDTILQALTKQDEHIEELESAAQEMQEQLAAANKSVEQYASSMQKVRSLLHI